MPTNLEKQIAMNRQTWFALQQHGAKEGMELRLDFSFNASSRKAANELFARLKAETDYDLRVESSGSFLSRKWRVEGADSGDAGSSLRTRRMGSQNGPNW